MGITIFFIIFLAEGITAEWSEPVQLAMTPKSLTTARDIYIDPSTGIRHILYVSLNFSLLHYSQLDANNKVLLIKDFGDPKLFSVENSLIVGSGDGKGLYVVMGAVNWDKVQSRDKWYTESQDGGNTWTPLVKVPRDNSDDDFERDDATIMIIPNTKRVFIFYTRYKGLSTYGSICMVTKPYGSSILTKEVPIYTGGITRPPVLSSEYTLVYGQAILYVFFGSYQEHYTSLYYISSSNNGIHWTDPAYITAAHGFDHTTTFTSVSDPVNSQFVAGLFKAQTGKLGLVYKKGNSDWKVVPASDRRVGWKSHYAFSAGMTVTGKENNRLMFLLYDESTDEYALNYSVWDINKMTYKTEKPPSTENIGTSGIRLSSYINQDNKIIVSALWAVVRNNIGYLYIATDTRAI